MKYPTFIHRDAITIISMVLAIGVNDRMRAENSDADALMDNIFKHAGIKNDIVVMPRAGDGCIAAALARRGVKIVYAMAPDDNSVAAALGPAEKVKSLGWQVMVRKYGPPPFRSPIIPPISCSSWTRPTQT